MERGLLPDDEKWVGKSFRISVITIQKTILKLIPCRTRRKYYVSGTASPLCPGFRRKLAE
jgi:hypothetical protein